jgi:hypothetical protein
LRGNNQSSERSTGNLFVTDDLYDYSKSDRYILSLGVNLDATLEYRIRGIRIDNLSHSWLLLRDLNRYVPPLTMGWQSIMLTPSTRIRVEFANAPPGGIASAQTGENPVVEVYGWPVPEKAGISLGTISASPTQPNVVNDWFSNLVPDSATHVLIPQNDGFYITILELRYGPTLSGPVTIITATTFIRLFISAIVDQAVLTPNKQDVQHTFPGGIRLPGPVQSAQDVLYEAECEDASMPQLSLGITYFYTAL